MDGWVGRCIMTLCQAGTYCLIEVHSSLCSCRSWFHSIVHVASNADSFNSRPTISQYTRSTNIFQIEMNSHLKQYDPIKRPKPTKQIRQGVHVMYEVATPHARTVGRQTCTKHVTSLLAYTNILHALLSCNHEISWVQLGLHIRLP